MEDWDDEAAAKTSSRILTSSITRLTPSTTSSFKTRSTTSRRSGDDFVIGVQDWRDTELIAPKSSSTVSGGAANGIRYPPSSSPVNANQPAETALKGGSITPGSGEYDHQKANQADRPKEESVDKQKSSKKTDNPKTDRSTSKGWFAFFRSGPANNSPSSPPPKTPQKSPPSQNSHKRPKDGKSEPEGLWVTLTPTSVSTSPFFDTLLVLVVSPLVTLTVVYALLLLRSRIRRRRWRAPKSVVERLPVRTYHTMSTSSSTTSSHITTPNHSHAASPLLHPTIQDMSYRTRPRSQTTTGIPIEGNSLSSHTSIRSVSRSPPSEKPKAKSSRRKRYNGRQVECVVCLEEYVDGESRVMSLPCGHEFHANCITPWFVNRRRTCPICKGDVVRSMARASNGQQGVDQRQQGDETSEHVQDRVAETVNEDSSAAIPIPSRINSESEDEDLERGEDIGEPLLGHGAEQQASWRNVVARSLSRLSGDDDQ